MFLDVSVCDRGSDTSQALDEVRHSQRRFVKFVTLDLGPCPLNGSTVTRGTRRPFNLSIFRRDLLEVGSGHDLADGLHESVSDDNRNVGTSVPSKHEI